MWVILSINGPHFGLHLTVWSQSSEKLSERVWLASKLWNAVIFRRDHPGTGSCALILPKRVTTSTIWCKRLLWRPSLLLELLLLLGRSLLLKLLQERLRLRRGLLLELLLLRRGLLLELLLLSNMRLRLLHSSSLSTCGCCRGESLRSTNVVVIATPGIVRILGWSGHWWKRRCGRSRW